MGRSNGIRVPQRLRRDPVLTVSAMEVAAEHSEAHRQRAGQCMEEGLLLDGIELQRTDVSMRHEQLSATIEANAANTIEPVEDYAPMPARKTAELTVLQVFV